VFLGPRISRFADPVIVASAAGPALESQTSASGVLQPELNKPRKGKRRLPTRNPAPLQATQTMNECWSADFMSDALWDGRRFRKPINGGQACDFCDSQSVPVCSCLMLSPAKLMQLTHGWENRKNRRPDPDLRF
jgi:hypothetical protein